MSTRLTVSLTERAVLAVDEIAAREGVSKTDAINRALQVYAFLVNEQALGKELMLGKDGGFERVRII